MTPAERKALLFLAAVALLGAGTRALTARAEHARAAPTPADSAALDAQLAAVDSAREARETRPTNRRPKRRRARPDSAAPAPAPSPVRPPPSRTRPSTPSAPIDLDLADSATLEALPGVGPALAARIVTDRTTHGPFGSLDALQQVRGIGPRLAARLAPYVTFSATPRPPRADTPRRSRP